MFSCETLQPFEVWTFPFAFGGDPELQWKHWIVGANFPSVQRVVFFKPTSQLSQYDREPSRLLGAVEYREGNLSLFSVRTIIPPDSYPVPYAYLRSRHANGELVYKGRLPADFRERMNQAVTRSEEFRKKQRDDFFRWFQKGDAGD